MARCVRGKHFEPVAEIAVDRYEVVAVLVNGKSEVVGEIVLFKCSDVKVADAICDKLMEAYRRIVNEGVEVEGEVEEFEEDELA